MKRSALLLGATGLIGGYCLTRLLNDQRYGRVTVLSRRPLAVVHPKLTVIETGLDAMADQSAAFQVDDVFCCLGTTLKKAGSKDAFVQVDQEFVLAAAQLAKQAGVQRFLVVTALNANASSVVFYSRVKGLVERGLKQLDLPLLAVFQPSLLIGERKEVRFAEGLANRIQKLVDPLLRWTQADWLPVDARLVADAMVGMALTGPGKGAYQLRYRDFLVYAGKFQQDESSAQA